jgi:hypothetical protein
MIQSRDRAAHNVQEIDKQEALEYNERCKAEEQRARGVAPLRPFKPPLPAEVAWLAQYANGSLPAEALPAGHTDNRLRRYRTLVYDGPSRTGKSERATHWFTEARTLKLNCQGVACPNMREFLSGQYDAVLCEETTWRIMWDNRQLFQAGPWRVQLGQSPCNEHCYNVWVWGVPFIICSNNFWQSCDDNTARAWVEANIVYVRWETPTWMSDALQTM